MIDQLAELIPAGGLAEEAGWQSMDTAPKDGTHVLLSCDERTCHYVTAGWHDDRRGSWWIANEDYTDAHSSPIYPQFWQPMPLPAPAAALSAPTLQPGKDQPR